MDNNNDRYNRDDINRQMQEDEIERCSDAQSQTLPSPEPPNVRYEKRIDNTGAVYYKRVVMSDADLVRESMKAKQEAEQRKDEE
jgi:hypothetical protein